VSSKSGSWLEQMLGCVESNLQIRYINFKPSERLDIMPTSILTTQYLSTSFLKFPTDDWMKQLSLALGIFLAGSTAVYAATATDLVGNMNAGKDKSTTCAACHGVDGNSPVAIWPNLAGQHASYIVQQLKNFKTASRSDPSMTPMATPLTDQDVVDLAAYFSTQTVVVGTVGEEWMEIGQKIYRGGNKVTGVPACIACHGAKGKGNPVAKYPAISGQKADYSHKQLVDYKSGARKPEGQAVIMKDVASKMTEEEMKAVTNYMQGLQ
jgi:cytochrome c553